MWSLNAKMNRSYQHIANLSVGKIIFPVQQNGILLIFHASIKGLFRGLWLNREQEGCSRQTARWQTARWIDLLTLIWINWIDAKSAPGRPSRGPRWLCWETGYARHSSTLSHRKETGAVRLSHKPLMTCFAGPPARAGLSGGPHRRRRFPSGSV